VITVLGHSMGNAAALHLAANTDLCMSAVFLNGVGLTPHRSVLMVYYSVHILFTHFKTT